MSDKKRRALTAIPESPELIAAAERQGFIAAMKGLPLDFHPYDPDLASARYAAWANGFRQTRALLKDSKRQRPSTSE